MRIKTIESNAEWDMTFKVIDKKAKRAGKKYLVYSNKSELSSESLAPEIFKSINQANKLIAKSNEIKE